jgi:hypothetical protein
MSIASNTMGGSVIMAACRDDRTMAMPNPGVAVADWLHI